MKNTKILEYHLAAAAEAARHALDSMRPERDAFLDVLHRFEVEVKAADVQIPPNVSPSVRDTIEAFRMRYNQVQGKLDGLVERTSDSLSKAFLDIERNTTFVTVMLFGRTRAGKSTTMEALTGGNGASIGIGKQHTTTDIQEYYFPRSNNSEIPNGPALRIVDTPGIEGFCGEALATMAEEFIERSDHILFLLTDDKATADELDRFKHIHTLGKGVTVLLNVKATDDNLDLLVSNPELIFIPEEINGHSRRIRGYLERRYDMPQPRVIPLHARAAWLGRCDVELPDGIISRDALVRNSRLLDVEDRISEFIRHEAIPARLRAPRDLVLSYLSVKDILRPFAGEFRQMRGDLQRLVVNLEGGVNRARSRMENRMPLLMSRFQAASDGIPAMIDEVIAAGGRGTLLNSQWRQLLQRHGVADANAWFVTEARQQFQAELEEEVHAAHFDYEFNETDDLEGLLGEYHNAQEGEQRNKYARAGMRTFGSVGLAGLTAWAVTNWWNPTGWAAGVGAALTIGAGLVGESVARQAADEWERSSKKDMYEKRAEIIAKLREKIWADFHGVRSSCKAWLDQAEAIYLDLAHEVVRPVEKSTHLIYQAVVTCLCDIDEVADRVNIGLVSDIFRANVPECADGTVQLCVIARSADCHRTKVIVSAAHSSRVNAIAACIGREGKRIRQIATDLGGERIDLIDGNAPQQIQVLQALGLRKSEYSATTVSLCHRTGKASTVVRVDSPQVAREAVGYRGGNIHLANRILGINIVIEVNE